MTKGQQANLNATLSSSLYLSFSKNSFFWCSSGCSLKADAKVGIFLTPTKNWQRNLHAFNFRLHLTSVTSSKCVRTHYNINASQTNQATHTTTLQHALCIDARLLLKPTTSSCGTRLARIFKKRQPDPPGMRQGCLCRLTLGFAMLRASCRPTTEPNHFDI